MSEVAVLENVDGPALRELGDERAITWVESIAELDEPAGVRALIVRNATRVDAAMLRALPNLRIVARAGAGLDNIDVGALEEAGIVLSYAPSDNTDSTAEHTLALALAAARGIAAGDRLVRQGRWNRRPGLELRGHQWGVIGLGRIGSRVAELAAAIGMTALGADPGLSPGEIRDRGAEPASVEAICSRCRVISLHVPLEPGARPILGEPEIALLGRDAIVVNTARGGLVDETALAQALAREAIAGAALDVRDSEPPATGDPLRSAELLTSSPHVAGITAESQTRILATIVSDLRSVLNGASARSSFGIATPREPGGGR